MLLDLIKKRELYKKDYVLNLSDLFEQSIKELRPVKANHTKVTTTPQKKAATPKKKAKTNPAIKRIVMTPKKSEPQEEMDVEIELDEVEETTKKPRKSCKELLLL